MKILVVEDDATVAELLQEALERIGNSCVVAPNADRADELLRRHSVDAVTLDLGMPGTGGLEWLESVARSRPGLAKKTLVITGLVLEPEWVVQLARYGAGLLAKPFSMEGLYEAVRTQLDHAAGERQRLN